MGIKNKIRRYDFLLIIIIYIVSIIALACLKSHTQLLNKEFFNIITKTTPIFIALLVYFYTTDNHRRQLLNELDSKSEWRKKLFEIAGQKEITIEHVFQLRAALRFTEKDIDKCEKNFDKMNVIIIKYCKKLTNENIYSNPENSNPIKHQQQNIIRLFSRYLLADHWEKNQRKDYIMPKEKEIELCRYTLSEFLKLNGKDNTVDTGLDNLFKDAKKLIED